MRVSSFRLLGATNRPGAMRPDLGARLKLSLRLPGLNERREDIPLLALHLLRSIARENRDIAARLFPRGNLEEEPPIALELMNALVRRVYKTHVRELEALLWEALTAGPEGVLGVPRRSSTPLDPGQPGETKTPSRPAPSKPFSAQALEAALAENEGNLERTWRALGLGSRHVLARLMAKHGIRRRERA